MSPAGWHEITSIVWRAAELPSGLRTAFVRSACGADAELRREVEALLEHDTAAVTAFARNPLASRFGLQGDTQTPAVSVNPPPSGQMLGPYRLLTEIGAGGMGAVFLAERADRHFDKLVAIKLLRPDRRSGAIVRRFHQEWQALARLEHPNIARLLDAGEGPSGPYLVMEFIEGEPITVDARRRGLSMRQRVALAADVCDAVQHAHQRGVIHRDLKPSNVLVDVEGRVRIVDFGVARLIGDEPAAVGAGTLAGELLGTPAYMSPEQAAGDGEIDTRSDIYAVGALLYELLAGRTPHQIEDASMAEALRAVRETDPPRLGQLNRALCGELDLIVSTAMHRDREKRYASAAEFGSDLRRHLRDEPVLARPPDAWYYAAKLCRRHRWTVVAAGLTLASLVGGSGVAYWSAHRARAEARTAWSAVEMVRELAQRDDLWEPESDPGAIERLRRLAARLPGWCRDNPRIDMEVCAVVGTRLAQTTPEARPDAERLLRFALRVQEASDGSRMAAGSGAAVALGRMLASQGRTAEAELILRSAVEALDGPGDTDTRLASAVVVLAGIVCERDRQAGLGMYESALAACQADGGQREAELILRCGRARTLHSFGRYGDAEPDRCAVLQLVERGTIAPPGVVADTLSTLAHYAIIKGDATAIPRLLACADNLCTNQGRARIRHQMAGLLWVREEFEAAEPLFRDAVNLVGESRRFLGAQWSTYVGSLGVCLRDMRKYAEAEPLLREALEQHSRQNGLSHPSIAGPLVNLSKLLRCTGRLNDAEGMAETALHHLAASFGPEHPGPIEAKALVGLLRAECSGLATGLPLLEEAIASRREWVLTNWQAGFAVEALATALASAGRAADGERLLRDEYERLATCADDENLATVRACKQLERFAATHAMH